MPQKITFIINKSRKLKASSLETIDSLKKLANYTCTDFITNEPKHATELALKASENGFDFIIAVGGDGTCNEVVNGIMLSQRRSEVIFGIIPNGSGNDFQKNIGDFSPQKFTESLLRKNSKSIDIIRLQHKSEIKYALNIVGIGFDGHVVQKLQNIRCSYGLKGKFAYAISILSSFLSFQKQVTHFQSGDDVIHGKMLMAVVCNGHTFGHGLIIQPEAKIDDGKLNIAYLGNVSFFDYIRNLGKLKRGEFVQHPEVQYLQGMNVSISMDGKGLYTEMDGEYFSQGDVTFEIVPSALQLLIL